MDLWGWSGFRAGSKAERTLVVRQKVIFYRMRSEELTTDFDVGNIVYFYVGSHSSNLLELAVIIFQSSNSPLSEFLLISPKKN